MLADTLDGQVVGAKSAIAGGSAALDNAEEAVNTFIHQLWEEFNQNMLNSITPQKRNFLSLSIIFFSTTIACAILTLLGGATEKIGKYTNCTGVKCIDDCDDRLGAYCVFIAWVITFLFSAILFFMSGALLPVGVITSDTCVLLDELPSDVQGFLGPAFSATEGQMNPVAVLDGCFKNTSILESLNMSSTFDFANDIDFSGRVSSLVQKLL